MLWLFWSRCGLRSEGFRSGSLSARSPGQWRIQHTCECLICSKAPRPAAMRHSPRILLQQSTQDTPGVMFNETSEEPADSAVPTACRRTGRCATHTHTFRWCRQYAQANAVSAVFCDKHWRAVSSPCSTGNEWGVNSPHPAEIMPSLPSVIAPRRLSFSSSRAEKNFNILSRYI